MRPHLGIILFSLACARDDLNMSEALDALPVEAAPVPEMTLSFDGGVVLGEEVSVVVQGTLGEGERIYLVGGLQGEGPGRCPRGLGGQCLGVLAPFLLADATADEAGQASFVVPLPPAAQAGGTFTLQAAVVRGLRGRDSLLSGVISSEITDCSTSYGLLEACPASSCADAMANGGSTDGTYHIQLPGSATSMPRYCEQQTNGGGWMLSFNLQDYSLMTPLSGYIFSATDYGTSEDPAQSFRIALEDWGAFTELRVRCESYAGGVADGVIAVDDTLRTGLLGIRDIGVAPGSPFPLGTMTRLPTNTIWTSDFSAGFRTHPNSGGYESSFEPLSSQWGGYWAPHSGAAAYSECNRQTNANDGSGREWQVWVR